MTDIRIALHHRRRRLAVLVRHIQSLSRLRRGEPASRQTRQDRYLWSRLVTLHRRAPRYELVSIRRLDAEPDAVGSSTSEASAEASHDAVWEVRLRGPRGIRHRVGDTVLVRWLNDPERVSAVMQELRGPRHEAAPGSTGTAGSNDADRRTGKKYLFVGHSSVFQPGRLRRLPLQTILEEELELYTAGPGLLDRVTTAGPSRLDQLTPANAGGGRGMDLLNVLKSATPAVTPKELIRNQGRNTARAYSVSRIERYRRHDEVEIIVSAVQTHLKQAEGPIVSVEGRATAWFRRLAELGLAGQTGQAGDASAPPVFVQAWRLRHPWRLDVVGARPMVIIVAGTGIAGVLAWLRDTTPKGPVWLIYGVRDWQTRGLYQEELTHLVSVGTLVRLDVAESRSTVVAPSTVTDSASGEGPAADEKLEAEIVPTAGIVPAGFHRHHRMRVNHVIEAEDETLRAMIAGGAGIYISGPRPMGEAARKAIMWSLGEDASPDLLERWDAEGRLQVSVS